MVAVVRQAALWLGLASVSVRGERIWAVIVAGSSGFHNYRHQVDQACKHACDETAPYVLKL